MNALLRPLLVLLALCALFAAAPDAAYAYGGPGSIISGLGTLLAVIAAVLASLFGFVWYPLKRLYRALRGDDEEEPASATTDASGQ